MWDNFFRGLIRGNTLTVMQYDRNTKKRNPYSYASCKVLNFIIILHVVHTYVHKYAYKKIQ